MSIIYFIKKSIIYGKSHINIGYDIIIILANQLLYFSQVMRLKMVNKMISSTEAVTFQVGLTILGFGFGSLFVDRYNYE